jgi:hypothetical protein
MSFRQINTEQWSVISGARLEARVFFGLPEQTPRWEPHWKYWVHPNSSHVYDTAGIKLCADRGDPFAKRLWARIIAARLAQ